MANPVLTCVVLVVMIWLCESEEINKELHENNRFDKIEELLALQSRQISELTKKVSAQEKEIVNLKQLVKECRNTVSANTNAIGNVTDQLNKSKSKDSLWSSQAEDIRKTYDGTMAINQEKVLNMGVSVRKERLLLRGIDNDMNRKIGFFANMDNPEQLGQHKVMVFGSVRSNLGLGYSNHTGVFRTPVSGLYGFSCSLYASHMSRGMLYLVVNDDVQATIFVDSDSDNWDLGPSSVTIVVLLNQGDEVFIRSVEAVVYSNIGTMESGKFAKSSFTGWLIAV